MDISKNSADENLALSIYLDQSTQDYYENLYTIPNSPLADNMYTEAQYGNYGRLYGSEAPPSAK